MSRLSNDISAIKPVFDVIIIGSGYGGGVAAARLARAGWHVCVLERGREFQTGQFPAKFPELRAEMQVTAKSFKTGSPSALYDVRLGADMHVLVGCGVGGGSLVNAGVALRPDARVFADEVWPGQIRQDGLLDEGYRRAARWLRPNADPRAREMTKFKALSHCSEALGVAPIAPTVAVSFEATTNPAGVDQPACTRCGDCVGGCNVGAKNTVALTYLAEAKRHGAEIFERAKVRHVTRAADGTWRVTVERLDTKSSETADLVVTAPMVIVAAGTLGSTEILLRSREQGLALSDTLGQRFSANGDIIAFGYGATIPVNGIGVGHPAKVADLEIGASVAGQIEIVDAEDLSKSLTIQEGVVPSALAPMLPVMFVPNGRLLGALQSLISGVYKGPFAGLQTFFAVSHDSASGKFSLEGDQLALAWPNAKDEPVYQRLDKALDALVTRAGGSYVKNPLAGTVMGHQPATAHPLGGAAMAATSATGVVDHKCRVFDPKAREETTAVHEGLYVIDGSVIPRSLGCNPLLTITALAERALLHMAADYGFDAKDDDRAPTGIAA
jgi:cholesterol oxidase